MYVLLNDPSELQKPLKHQCKFCHNPNAEHIVEYHMNRLTLTLDTGTEHLYTYAAFCNDCGGLSVVALQGVYDLLDHDPEGAIYE